VSDPQLPDGPDDETIMVARHTPPADETVMVQRSNAPVDETVVVQRSAPPEDETVMVQRTAPPADETVVVQRDSAPDDETIVVQRTVAPADETVMVRRDAASPQTGFDETVVVNRGASLDDSTIVSNRPAVPRADIPRPDSPITGGRVAFQPSRLGEGPKESYGIRASVTHVPQVRAEVSAPPIVRRSTRTVEQLAAEQSRARRSGGLRFVIVGGVILTVLIIAGVVIGLLLAQG